MSTAEFTHGDHTEIVEVHGPESELCISADAYLSVAAYGVGSLMLDDAPQIDGFFLPKLARPWRNETTYGGEHRRGRFKRGQKRRR